MDRQKMLDEDRITIRLDEETKTVLDELLKQEGPNVRGRTSVFIRKLIHEERERRSVRNTGD
jgi:hypothetical protein